MNKSKALIGAAVIAALVFSGCTSNDDDPEEADPSATETVDEGDDDTTSGSSSSHIDIDEIPGSLEDFVGAHEDATTDACEAGGSGWIAEGTVTNPTDDAQSYRIYVSARADGNTVGLVQVDVDDVPAGESGTWEADFDLDEDGLDCLLRVERFTPAG